MMEKRISYLLIFLIIFIIMLHSGGSHVYTSLPANQSPDLPGARESNSNKNILLMDEDRLVDAGETLSISAGTVVSLGKDVRLTIIGRLLVEGEKNDPVIFQRSDPLYSWESILIEEGGFAHISNAKISGGTRTLICNNSSPILENLSISDAQNGLIVSGNSKPLVRNIILDNVVNGIGLRADEISRTNNNDDTTQWLVNISSAEGSLSYPAQRLGSESFNSLISDFKNLYDSDPGSVLLESRFHLSAYDHLSVGGLRLVLSYDRPIESALRIKVWVNGIIQSASQPQIISGTSYGGGFGENLNFFQVLEGSGFYHRYKDILMRGNQTGGEDIPQVPNMLPNEHHLALKEGFSEGLNVIRVELNANSFSDMEPSVFIESALKTGGVYDNISISNGGDWGIFILNSEPLFSRVNVNGGTRQVVVKGCSRPIMIECNFFGKNALSGISSLDVGAYIKLLDSKFADFACAPVELSQGTAAIVSCRFDNISVSGMGVIQLDTNPNILPNVSELLETRPIVIHGIEMNNISGWAIKVMGGRMSVTGSMFSDCENVLYIGEGTKANIYGNTLRNVVSTGLLIYRAIDNRVNINSNHLIGMGKYGILVKQTSVSISDNIIEGCLDLTSNSGALTATYLLQRNWALYVENSICRIEKNRMGNNTFSILAGIDSTVQIADNQIGGKDGIGIGVLSEKPIHISDTKINVVGGFDLVTFKDSKISFDETIYNTTVYIDEDDNRPEGSFFGVILLFVLVFVTLVRGKIKN